MTRFRMLCWLMLGLVSGMGTAACRSQAASDPQQRESREEQRAVVVKVVTLMPLQEMLKLTGTLRAAESVELRSEISGRIAAVDFVDGQAVKEGDLLVKIDDREIRAELSAVRIQLRQAQQQEERYAGLLEKGLASKEQYDEIQNRSLVLKAQQDVLTARFRKTEIRAPFDGRMGLRNVSPGAMVQSSTLMSVLQQIHVLYLDFAVPEQYQSRVYRGMAVSFRIATDAAQLFAEVVAIDPQVDELTRNLRLRARVSNSDETLMAGNSAVVVLTLQELPDAILIDTTALELGLQQTFVHVVDNEDIVHRRQVTVGTRKTDQIQILTGLSAGDRVVVRGEGLRDGMRVHVVSMSRPKNAVEDAN